MIFSAINNARPTRNNHEMDFAIALGNAGRFRVNAFLQNRRESIVFRTIPTAIPTLEQLGMPKIVSDLTKKEKGLALVTGPTGSGKSTTLAAIVDYRNTNSSGHTITVEDPIEFVHQHQNPSLHSERLA